MYSDDFRDIDNIINLPLPQLRDNTSSYEVQEMQHRHQEIIRLVSLNYTDQEIAEIVGVDPLTVSNTRRSSLGVSLLDHINAEANSDTIDIKRRITETSAAAIELLNKVITNTGDEQDKASMGQRLEAAKEILRMDGYTPVRKVELDDKRGWAERNGMERIAQRAELIRQQRLLEKQQKALTVDSVSVEIQSIDREREMQRA